jgi:hypothetical protein
MKKPDNISYLPLKEAELYVSQKDDLFGMPAYYFTYIPSTNEKYPSSEGWENVIYYTNRLKQYETEYEPGYQCVYIFKNKTMPGLLKIGYTDKDPFIRAENMSRSTGIPVGFEVIYSFACFNGIRLEREVHLELDKYRINTDREFFNISIENAVEVIERLGQKYKFKNKETPQ